MSSTFVPANSLEIALKKAVEDPASRPTFFRELLGSNILILPAGELPIVIGDMLAEGQTMRLAQVPFEGQPGVPFFTSELRLPIRSKHLRIAAKGFFEMTRGAILVMNPGSAYGKGFLPEECRRGHVWILDRLTG